MSNALATRDDTPIAELIPAPRAMALAASGGNVGAVAIEQERAIAEARGQMQLAKMFPRDLTGAYAEVMEACSYPELAEVAFYAKPQGGGTVRGPSIRLAEEIARIYGNFEYGHRELSRSNGADGKSEVEVYAWDKEKNNRSIRQLTVYHVRDTREGPKPLRDQSDVDIKIANVASKQVRGRILALLPKFLVQAAIAKCEETLRSGGKGQLPHSERVRRMTQAFAGLGITVTLLEQRLGHKLDETTPDELVDFLGIYNSIREGSKSSEFFGTPEPKDESDTAGAIKAAAKKDPKPKAEKKADAPKDPPAPANDPTPEPEVQPEPEAQAEEIAPEPETPAELASAPAATLSPPEGDMF